MFAAGCLLMLYKWNGQEKYYKAAWHLVSNWKSSPGPVRAVSGMRKHIPSSMADGLYMRSLFCYMLLFFMKIRFFAGITKQFVSIDQPGKHCRDDYFIMDGMIEAGSGPTGDRSSPKFWGTVRWDGMERCVFAWSYPVAAGAFAG